MPRPYEDYVWPKATVLQRLSCYAMTVPWLQRLTLGSLKRDLSSTGNAFIECYGLEEDRREPSAIDKTCIYPLVIGQSDFAAVRRACKAQQVSVHSAIQAAGTQAIVDMIVDASHQQGVDIHSYAEQNVNCSGVLSRDDVTTSSSACPLVYVMQTRFKLEDYTDKAAGGDFWSRARRIQAHIRASMVSSQVGFLLFSRAGRGYYEQLLDGRMNILLAFTNLGNCNYLNRPRAAGLKINAHYSAATEHRAGAIFCNAVTSVDDKLCWSVTYYTNVTTQELAARYLHRAVDVLLRNCATCD